MNNHKSKWLYPSIGLVFSILFIRHAWIGDDAYITLRTVANLVDGFGPRWNIAERVQTFTHPLWMLLLSSQYFMIRDHYLVVIWTSYLLSCATVMLILRQVRDRDCSWSLIFVILSLLGSKSFMDYTTSGLENPLSYLLITLFIVVHLTSPRSFLLQCAIAGLLTFNRMDLCLLTIPVLIQEAWHLRHYHSIRKITTWTAIGFLPLFAWLIFSLIYYGFLFPNTYYAKLNTGVLKLALWQQGLAYFIDLCGRDPVTLIALSLCAFSQLTSTRTRALGWGIVIYLMYVINIGGDFMSGRFFSVPLVASVTIFAASASPLSLRKSLPILCALLTLLIVCNKKSTFASNSTYSDPAIPPNGIADERGWYFQNTGLLRWTANSRFPEHFWRDQGELWQQQQLEYVEYSNVGMTGFFAGPHVHIIDNNALTEPLLSRLPIKGASIPGWRIGHFHRDTPPQYLQSLKEKDNLISDPQIHALYDKIYLITRGPIWSFARWKVILSY